MPKQTNPDVELATDFAKFYDDPLGFVLYAFPWGEAGTPLEHFTEPDEWQKKYLRDIGEETKLNAFNGKDAVPPLRFATSSGHGIGKSTMVAWQILWVMSTRPFCKGTVTANTINQLFSKTWAELGKWYGIFIAKHWFVYNSKRGNLFIAQKDNLETWRCDTQTAKVENSEAFAGQHAANSSSFYIFDEASAIDNKIWEVAEGGLTDGEPMMFVYGNPTRNTGAFRECFRKNRHRWNTRTIDSRTVTITNKKQIAEWVEDNGEDSDFIKVRVRGVFPSQSFRQFISEDLVDGAYAKHLKESQYSFAPSIIGVDPAWTGEDEFVIYHRKGLFSEVLEVVQKNDNDILMAQKIMQHEKDVNAQMVFVDGGFGTGIVSAGRTFGRNWQIVWFSGKSPSQECLNLRSYIWEEMRKWLKEGGAIPDDPTLRTDLTSPELVPRSDGKKQLESKEDMKRRGFQSPNRADALALTFTAPVSNNDDQFSGNTGNVEIDFNPYE
jgi:hypothetical protein